MKHGYKGDNKKISRGINTLKGILQAKYMYVRMLIFIFVCMCECVLGA